MRSVKEMKQDPNDVVLVLTVVLDHGQEVIEVRAKDRPSLVALRFCKAHQLDPTTVPTMTRFIQEQLEENQLSPHTASASVDKGKGTDVHDANATEEALKIGSPKKPSNVNSSRSLVDRKPTPSSNRQAKSRTPISKPVSHANSTRPTYAIQQPHTSDNGRTPSSNHGTGEKSALSSMQAISLFKSRRPFRNKSSREIDSRLLNTASLDYSPFTSTLDPPSISRTLSGRSDRSQKLFGSEEVTPHAKHFTSRRKRTPKRSGKIESLRSKLKKTLSEGADRSSSGYSKPTATKPGADTEVNRSSIYQLIFSQLKPTHKGTLTYATITRGNLSDSQAAFLKPMLEKLIITSHEMGFEEFCADIAYLESRKGAPDLMKLFMPKHNPRGSRSKARKHSSNLIETALFK